MVGKYKKNAPNEIIFLKPTIPEFEFQACCMLHKCTPGQAHVNFPLDSRNTQYNIPINRKFRVATEIGSNFFGCWPITGLLKKCNMIFYHKHEISDRKNTIMPYIGVSGFWPDRGRRSMEFRSSK
jgi:hypothetical protein